MKQTTMACTKSDITSIIIRITGILVEAKIGWDPALENPYLWQEFLLILKIICWFKRYDT